VGVNPPGKAELGKNTNIISRRKKKIKRKRNKERESKN
jgi:hypothetical protein